MINILTIDLEDYYQVSAFESVVKREDWDKYESRIERNTYRLLEILNDSRIAQSAGRRANELSPAALRLEPCAVNVPPQTSNPQPETSDSSPAGSDSSPCTADVSSGVKATFFCLGWNAERYPHLIREIHQLGHEIACHGYDHRLVYDMSPEQFREDIRKSKQILEDIIGEKVSGYRASSYSITGRSLWAFQILAEEGFRYDSSIFPIHHDRYGIPNAPRFPFLVDLKGGSDPTFIPFPSRLAPNALLHGSEASTLKRSAPLTSNGYILELPISTVRLFGQNIPISGGGYFRLFPYLVIKSSLKRINHQDKSPFVTYVHPWELDPDQPRVGNISLLTKFRHYINLESTAGKLKRLLRDFTFSSMEHVFDIR